MSKLFFLTEFVLSFIPLWIAILVKYIFYFCKLEVNIGWYVIVLLPIALIISWIVFSLILNQYKNFQGQEYEILEIQECKCFSTEILLTYVLPLAVFDFMSLEGIVEFLVLMGFLVFFTLRNNKLCGIFFEIIGCRYYKCKIRFNSKEMWINLFSKVLLEGDEHTKKNIVQLNNQIWILFKEKQNAK